MKMVCKFNKKVFLNLILNVLIFFNLSAQPLEDLPAFPQAEGFGAYSK